MARIESYYITGTFNHPQKKTFLFIQNQARRACEMDEAGERKRRRAREKKSRKSEDLFSYIIIVIECYRSVTTHREYKVSGLSTHTSYSAMPYHALPLHAVTCERLWCDVNIKCHIKFRTINFNHRRTTKTKPLTKNYNSYGSARTHERTHSRPKMNDSNVDCMNITYIDIYAKSAWRRRRQRQQQHGPLLSQSCYDMERAGKWKNANTLKTNQQST